MLFKNFSRWQFEIFFLIFPRKSALTVHANCLLWRHFARGVNVYFLRKIRKNVSFQNVVCCNFYPAYKSLRNGVLIRLKANKNLCSMWIKSGDDLPSWMCNSKNPDQYMQYQKSLFIKVRSPKWHTCMNLQLCEDHDQTDWIYAAWSGFP